MSYITAIGTANPAHRFSQSTIAEFMLRAMKLNNGDARKLKTIFRASGIEYRHSVLEDYGRVKDFTFYPDTRDLEPFPGTEKRLQIFRQNALALSIASLEDLLQSYPDFEIGELTHVIVVCCTGMYAPGLDIDLVNALKLRSTIQRTAINFMGCYASFNALKIADALCKSDQDAKVLIVCTELCSLHFQRTANEDNLLANALFADGSASLLVENHSRSRLKLKLEEFHSDLALEGVSDMAWTIGDLGFEMRLSSYVPDLIKKGIADLTNSLLRKVSANLSEIEHFAIHPGGRKILQVIEEELKINKERNEAAYYVLKNFGNMSSPTVLFVLKEVVKNLNGHNNGERILSFAFGPGLTLESMVLRIENTSEYA
ncbi:MAG: type III polyketide synthase [Cyclobacteriaceae bacterium]